MLCMLGKNSADHNLKNPVTLSSAELAQKTVKIRCYHNSRRHFFYYLSEKIRLEMIHMKRQVFIFSKKNNYKNLQCYWFIILFSALRVQNIHSKFDDPRVR